MEELVNMTDMALLDFAIRILCAVGFGFLIGLERQLTGHAAGIRINIWRASKQAFFVDISIN